MTHTGSMTRWLPLASLVLAFVGCPSAPPIEEDGGVDAGCAGLVGCECVAGACTVGECLGGTCTDCRRGEAACICRSNNTCNAGLRCATGLCQACPAGESGCPCGAGDTCGAGLACANGTCVTDTCTAGSEACPCRGSDPRCDGTQYCDATSLCRACSNDVEGCPCVSGACAGSTVCDATSMLCRAPVTCAQLRNTGACLPNQACVEAGGADATCTPMACEPQYKWNGMGCVACVTADCANEPTCAPGDAGLGDSCAAQNRSCVTMGQAASCGPCLSGFAQDTQGQCQPVPSCGTTTCPLTEYCNRTAAPVCLPLPCAPGSARDSTGTCLACTTTCAGAGFSGRHWPFRTTLGVCVCETLDGYFPDPGGPATAVLCDADEDGWVNEDSDDLLFQTEPALRANSRCNIRSTDRVRLVDEYGVWVDVLSCGDGLKKASAALPDASVPNGGIGLLADGGLLPLGDGGSPCSSILPLRLLETRRNDTPGRPMGTAAPEYGATGRRLEANELNALTKACVSTAADYNDNNQEDINEVQPLGGATDRDRLKAFAYFIELQSASYEAGVLVIRERSRCAPEFPLRYAVDGGLEPFSLSPGLPGGDQPYWRSCTRQRDPFFSATPRPGFDFAQFGCDTASGTCLSTPPPHPVLAGPVDPNRVLMRDHGLCRLGGQLPADGYWRGMNHHSQFKCVNVVSGPVAPGTPERPTSAFGTDTGQLTFNECVAEPCVAGADGGCSVAQGVGRQTRQPVLRCTPKAAGPLGSIGFASVNYLPYRKVDTNPNFPPTSDTYPVTTYLGGCVNEDDEPSSYLCPYPEFSLVKADADRNFGRYSCYGRGSNFLWAADSYPGGQAPRAVLVWAPTTGAADGGSVLR